MKIAFLLTSRGISGGHNVIFEHAFMLQKLGCEVDILGISKEQFDYAFLWHDRARFLRFDAISNKLNTQYDLALATNIESIPHLPRVAAGAYAYFMQAKEDDFVSEKSKQYKNFLFQICSFKLPIIVSASWMEEYLRGNFKTPTFVSKSGMRKDIFCKEGGFVSPRLGSGIRVLVEGPLEVEHKQVKKALLLASESRAKEVWLLTRSTDLSEVPYGVRTFSSVKNVDLGEIYRSCDLILKLSTVEGMFGPPLEMMHCGGTVICSRVSGCEEYLESGVNSFVFSGDRDEEFIEAINLLDANRELLNKLKQEALKTASLWPSWEEASKRFLEGLVWARNNFSVDRAILEEEIKRIARSYLVERWREKKGS